MILNDETLRFIRQHINDDVRDLALHTHNQPDVDLSIALTQIAGLQTLSSKVPSWTATEGILCPARLSLEQCSSEITARHKATLITSYHGSRLRLADLTGGLGIDCAFLAPLFKEVDYVERQETLCQLAKHNFPLLGLTHIHIHCTDGTDFLEDMPSADWLYLDPARRNSHGGKTVALAECEPDVSQLEEKLLAKAPHVLLKLSPMLDLTQALHTLKHVREAQIVAADNECKELLLVLERNHSAEADDIPVTCFNLTNQTMTAHGFTFTRREEQAAPCPLAEKPRLYLYEPNAALLKAGAFRSIPTKFQIEKLHPNSHLYTSDHLAEDFPGRIFQVENWCGFGKKETKALLEGIQQANLSIRNFPASVAELRKRLHIGEGGDVYLFATTLSDGQKVLIRARK